MGLNSHNDLFEGGVSKAASAVQSRNWRTTTAGARLVTDENGQALVWMVFLVIIFLGICALTVDLGHALLVKRRLQASCDAAALAAARTLPGTNYSTVAMRYTAATGSLNEYGDFSVGTPTITPLCLADIAAQGVTCSSDNPNAVSIKETATVRTFFAGIMGIKTMTVNATATAARGARPLPLNVAIVLDTTPSMDWSDPSCGKTQLQCATDGVQQLLSGLAPSLDRVSLFTFPNITTDTVKYDTDCSNTSPTTGLYTFPSATATSLTNMSYTSGWSTYNMTYQVTGYLTDYRSSDSAKSLSTSSALANAVGVGTSTGRGRRQRGCTGIQTSSNNTYYAGALYAAQASLMAEQAANPGTENVIILLSDGNATADKSNMVSSSTQSATYATASGSYPSWIGECGQGVTAANYAKSMGTTVYTIAYGSPSTSNYSNCASDMYGGKYPSITPCQAMQQMSSGWSDGDYSHFYSDYNLGGDTGCQAVGAQNGVTDLQSIFQAIQISLTGARLISNDTP